MTLRVGFKELHANAILPTYGSAGAAGMDLYAIEETRINPGHRVLMPTGLAVMLPQGYELQIRPRSGLALKFGVTVLNAPGTIDCDYRGEISVLLINISGTTVIFEAGDRIAQAVLAPVLRADPIWVSVISDTDRGVGAFGSTGA